MPGYAKIPDFINDEINVCGSDTFYVGRARRYSTDDLAAGVLEHLGLGWNGEAVTRESEAVVPPAERGRWSRYNVNGRVVVRKDLPKVEKVIGGWESPNFGDWEKGSHTHWATRMVYRRETWYAQQLPILLTVEEPNADGVVIGFRVDRVFDRKTPNERDLHLALSLLRENIGVHVSIVATDLSVDAWLADQSVTWELLPPGELTFKKIVARLGADPSSPRIATLQDRDAAMRAMNPGAVITGLGAFSRYFGYKFRDNLVALENLTYGNALYVMFDDWEALSQRSRIDLLADANADYVRIVHRPGWEQKLKALLTLRGHDVDGT